jgi:branched-chain amino acid transport system substrate-binding protein
VISVFTAMWGQLDTNKQVGGLFPNDGDGNAWGDPNVGFPPVLDKLGYGLVDPGRYQNLTDDFSAQINAFKQGNVEIVTGVPIPPDFTTFWNQAKQQGFNPKAASIGKAILFPQAVEALGDAGNNLSSEVWWSPSHPFKSSLNGLSAGRSGGCLHAGDRQTVDAADRLCPCPIRAGDQRDGPRQRCRRWRRGRRGNRGLEPSDHRRPDRL